MASFNYQEFQNQSKPNNQKQQGNYVSYFDLKQDGEEAIVRFMYNSPEEFNIFTVHPIQVDGKWRKVDCLNTPHESDKCPLCMAGNKAQKRFFIKLLHYVKDENGNVKAIPKIWERSTAYVSQLKNLMDEYGPLSDNLFKIKRNGAKGSVDTTYVIMYSSPAAYKPDVYIKDTKPFENFTFNKGFILNKTADEMVNLLNPETKQSQPVQQPTTEPRRTYQF